MNEEPFGPVALINPFKTFDEAIEQANRLPFGLAAYAFTQNAKTRDAGGRRPARAAWWASTRRSSPRRTRRSAGSRNSGHGAEDGPEGLDACLVTKAIHQA